MLSRYESSDSEATSEGEDMYRGYYEDEPEHQGPEEGMPLWWEEYIARRDRRVRSGHPDAGYWRSLVTLPREQANPQPDAQPLYLSLIHI